MAKHVGARQARNLCLGNWRSIVSLTGILRQRVFDDI
jgi:hypothetical protein